MIRITIDNKVPELTAKVQAGVSRFIRKGALHLHGSMAVSMADRKSGRLYKRGKDRVHQASAEGESPAIDSSNYINSIFIEGVFESNSLEAVLGTAIPCAPILEDPEGLNRPLWGVTVKQQMPTLEKMLEAEMKGL
jgi:hypothetical protein